MKNNSYFKFGLFTASLFGIIAVLTIFLALFINYNSVTFDITAKKTFSLSNKTKDILQELQNPVKIYYLEEQGNEDQRILSLLNSYIQESKLLSFEYRDPDLYPDFINSYKTQGRPIHPGSILLVCGDKYQIVDYFSFYTFNTENANQGIADGQPTGFKAQQSINRALLQVSGSQPCMIYIIKGQNQEPLPQDFLEELMVANYTMQEILITDLPKTSKENSILLFVEEKLDFSENELQILIDWLEDNGRACFFLQPEQINKKNRNNLLKFYSLKPVPFFIAETNPSFTIQGNPLFIKPLLSNSEIMQTSEIDLLPVIPITAGFLYEDFVPEETHRETLLSTTIDSVCVDDEKSTQGPFILASSIKSKGTKAVFFSSSSILNSEVNIKLSGGANNAFLQSCFQWLQDSEQHTSPIASISSETIVPNSFQRIAGTIYSIFILPIIITIFAVIHLQKRKNQHDKDTK